MSLPETRSAEVARDPEGAATSPPPSMLPDWLFRTMVEAHPAPMLLADSATGRILWANEAAARFYGYPVGAMTTLSVRDIALSPPQHPHDGAREPQRGPCGEIDGVHRLANGKMRAVEVSCAPVECEGRTLLFAVVRDIVARTEAQAQIADYERRLEDRNLELRKLMVAIEQSGSTIVITDAQGTIVYVNPRFEETSGYTAEEAVGKNPRILKSGEMDDAFYRSLWETITSGRTWRGEFHNKRKDGALYWESATIAPVVDPDGRVTHFIGIKEEITSRKEAEEALKKYAEQLEAQNAELDAFAHTVAHDLKGPLGALVGFSELLIDTPTMSEAERADLLARIHETGWQMTRILDALVLLSATRRKKVDIEPLDMGRIVARVVSRLEQMISEHGGEIIATPVEEWPVALGYAPWVEEVWVNYVSNALKYGGRPPRVEIGAELAPDGKVRFWVRDNGSGLSPQEQAQLFAPFTRLRQVSVEGWGLGLSIVRRIVERLSGTVGVESEVGKGSTFFFTLPRAPAAVCGLPAPQPPR